MSPDMKPMSTHNYYEVLTMEDKNRDRIIEAALKLFNYRGYKSVTMREIAKELGMSSKTFYNSFSSKEEIAEEVLLTLSRNIYDRIDDVKNSNTDPISKLKELLNLIKMELISINPLLIRDISLYVPKARDKMLAERDKTSLILQDFIIQGQNMGLIKKNIDPQMATYTYFGIFAALVKHNGLGNYNYSIDQVFDFLIEIFFNGICEKQ
jgi:AcrR family transcriptional regulator